MQLSELTVRGFADLLGSDAPAPGGGSAAALAGALGAALTAMVGSLTVGKKKYAEFDGLARETLEKARDLEHRFLDVMQRDTEAFNAVSAVFAMPPVQIMDQGFQVTAAQQQIIENFAKQGDCVIVGRCADVILKDYHPLNLFVYADAESKIQRCIDRAPEGEHLSRNDIARRMKQVDKNRAQYRQMFADNKWGAKETYHLCVNTSGHEIKDLIPGLAAFVRCWFGEK